AQFCRGRLVGVITRNAVRRNGDRQRFDLSPAATSRSCWRTSGGDGGGGSEESRLDVGRSIAATQDGISAAHAGFDAILLVVVDIVAAFSDGGKRAPASVAAHKKNVLPRVPVVTAAVAFLTGGIGQDG